MIVCSDLIVEDEASRSRKSRERGGNVALGPREFSHCVPGLINGCHVARMFYGEKIVPPVHEGSSVDEGFDIARESSLSKIS
jgi:hypothetical protein